MEIASYNNNWSYPTNVRVGAGRLQELGKCCRQLGMQAPLLITDPGLASLPIVEQALQVCRDAGLQVGLFSAVKGNPTGTNVLDGVAALKAGNHEGSSPSAAARPSMRPRPSHWSPTRKSPSGKPATRPMWMRRACCLWWPFPPPPVPALRWVMLR